MIEMNPIKNIANVKQGLLEKKSIKSSLNRISAKEGL